MFAEIRDHRYGPVTYAFADSLMDSFFTLSLSAPSFGVFAGRRFAGHQNIMTKFEIKSILCDILTREVLDGIYPNEFHQLL